ncbi:MAG: hypothetical protein CR979_02375 [Propionibacterium sp.]|nr:MAG: hypothetical protein CR979_02375 [Propionibacterium sp.]
MVRLLTRLQLKLGLRSYRGNTARIIGLLIIGAYVSSIILGLFFVALHLRTLDPIWAGTFTTVWFSLVTLMWPILMVLLGNNDPLSPNKFAVLPVDGRKLQIGLLFATSFTAGGFITSLMAICYVIAWSKTIDMFLWSALFGLVGLAFSMLTARTIVTAASNMLASRRFRDWNVVIVAALVMAAAFSGQLFNRVKFSVDEFSPIAQVLGWTPLGWAWSMPWHVVNQAWLAVGVKATLLVVTWLLLWHLWRKSLDNALTSPMVSNGGSVQIKSSGWLVWLFPRTPAGAIAVRTVRYWMRDPRRKVQAMSVMVLPVVMILAFSRIGGQLALLPVVPATTAIVGAIMVMSEICYDGSALADQILSSTSGRDDRVGRIMGISAVFLPASIVVAVLVVWLSGHWEFLWVELGATLGIFGVAAGVGSWAGAIWNYPMPPPGFGNISRGNLGAAGGIFLTLVIEMIFVAPIAVSGVMATFWPEFLWINPVISLIIGFAVFAAGINIGGSYLDEKWPEVLGRITWERT